MQTAKKQAGSTSGVNWPCVLLFWLLSVQYAYAGTMHQALALLRHADTANSMYWPHVPARELLHNIEANVQNPRLIYQGSATNFCGYAAFTYLMASYQPERYVQTMLDLYHKGRAVCGRQVLRPSERIRQTVGTIAGKGKLDLHLADQMWFYTLADQLKGYLNLVDQRYDPGNENTIWAATNYRKFNRMVRRMLEVPVAAEGSDLLRPHVGNKYRYLQEQLAQGVVVLYINSKFLYPSRNYLFRLRAPTHFIVLHQLQQKGDTYLMTYWDYGSKTFQALDARSFRKLIFGITTLPKPLG